ncbi:hypothetical protein AVEN_203582-1 [Araneus ventricosus]|uniref:Uncharacterized protein n=1 Tax=Araneus ventricosus TaxID=182803 RepID=A0A4Y2ELC7_ARAVE|nr:hypothetical protein AVEN_203582-1 [Araneus ventricosus]
MHPQPGTRTRLFIRRFLIHVLVVPPGGMRSESNLKRELLPPCLGVRGQLKNDHYNWDTEVAGLTAITVHGLLPPEGGMYHHRWRVTHPHHYYTPRETRTRLLIWRLLIHVIVVFPSVGG